MKARYRDFLDGQLSRRDLISSLVSAGVTAVAAEAMAQELEPYSDGDQFDAFPASAKYEMDGKGGDLLVAQLIAAGVEYIFINPSSTAGPVYDALVDAPQLQIIESVHEGNLTAMADGYARASGKTPFVLIARLGLPNAMAQMFNSWKDNIPIVVATDEVGADLMGQGGFQAVDHRDVMTQPITKWRWLVEHARKVPEVTRRAFKFASTQPGGPVFIAFQKEALHGKAKSLIIGKEGFAINMVVRPGTNQIAEAAALLLNAQNPLIYVGDEITVSSAESQVLELAELLGAPITLASSITWSIPFPTRHPLFAGVYQRQMRHLGDIDVMINIGGRMPFVGRSLKVAPETKLIQMRMDPVDLGRNYPSDVSLFCDIKTGTADLLAALREGASEWRLRQLSKQRLARARVYSEKRRETLNDIVERRWDRNPISIERVLGEIETVLEEDAYIVTELDSGARQLINFNAFGGNDKTYVANSGIALGWSLSAAFGVKLAQPNKPVVAILGDGAFLFSGPQPLWSYSRYQAPITVIVINNKSYNNERNRLWSYGGRMYDTGRDMVCYLGDPDVSYLKLAEGFGVAGEVVAKPDDLAPALKRAKTANAAGQAYLLDVLVGRDGVGGVSEWHPSYSVAGLRKRKV